MNRSEFIAEVDAGVAELLRTLMMSSMSTGWKARDENVHATEIEMQADIMPAVEPQIQQAVQLLRHTFSLVPPPPNPTGTGEQ